MRQAMTIRRADKIYGRTTDLQEIGFVFHPNPDAAYRQEDALALVHQVLVQDRMNKRVVPTPTRSRSTDWLR